MKTTRSLKSPFFLCLFLCSVISHRAFTQYNEKGIAFSVGVLGAMPLGDKFTKTHGAGAGGVAKFSFPLGFYSDFTFSIKATSFTGKPFEDKLGEWKPKNVLYFLAGYRYNFNPDIESAFYIEPKLGYALVGTKNRAVCYEPAFGYYFNNKFDAAIWYQNAATNTKESQIGAVGVTFSISFNNLFY